MKMNEKTMLMSLALVVLAMFIVSCAPGEAIAGQAIRVTEPAVASCQPEFTLVARCDGSFVQNWSINSCTGHKTFVEEKDCALNAYGESSGNTCLPVSGMPSYYADCFKAEK